MAENDCGQYLTTDTTHGNTSGDNGKYLQPRTYTKSHESGIGVGEYLTTEGTQRSAPTAPGLPEDNPPEYCEVVDEQGVYEDVRNSEVYSYIDSDPNQRPPTHAQPYLLTHRPTAGPVQGYTPNLNTITNPASGYQSLQQVTPVIQTQPGGLPQVVTSGGGNYQLQPGTQVLHVQPGDHVTHQGTTIVVQEAPKQANMIGHIVFSCFVFWCCNFLFGAIAFFVAIAGIGAIQKKGKTLGCISLGLNIAGIVITIVAICTILGVTLGSSSSSSTYVYNSYNRTN